MYIGFTPTPHTYEFQDRDHPPQPTHFTRTYTQTHHSNVAGYTLCPAFVNVYIITTINFTNTIYNVTYMATETPFKL